MLRTRSFSFVLALVAPVAVAILPAAALAEPPQAAPVAATPPTTKLAGAFKRFVLAPDGRPMGVMLADGTFVHTPGRALLPEGAALNAGDALEIEGVAVKTPVGTFVSRAVVAHAGTVVADARHGHRRHHKGHKGHHGRRAALQPMSAAGKVAVVIATPRSRVLAVVLDDGTTAVGKNLGTLGLKVGDRISIAGKGGVYPSGKALRIEKITLPGGETRELPPPPPPRDEQAPA